MARHSFIQIEKITNVKGRIHYIGSCKKQENLYATYHTADIEYWKQLAKESQQEFKKSGTDGSCIEARELIIALPEIYTRYEPNQILKYFTNSFKAKHGVECISALHHNKKKTNYHIHLIFSERKLLDVPEVKIAERNIFYNKQGKRVRTKKEIVDGDGRIQKGCRIVPKGEVYEKRLFTNKNPCFKSEKFLADEKERYTNLINYSIDNPEEKLSVFHKNSVYLPTKKIGKNNPKAQEIEADNEMRIQWNQAVDMALMESVPEAEILKVKREEITDKVQASIKEKGRKPDLFRRIVLMARIVLEKLMRRFKAPPKLEPTIDLQEFKKMQGIRTELAEQAQIFKYGTEVELPELKVRLESIGKFFKRKERESIEKQISVVENRISVARKALSVIVRSHGYSSVRDFVRIYEKSEEAVLQYEKELEKWEGKREGAEPKKSSVRCCSSS